MLKLDISKFVTSKKTKNNLRQISATPPESAQPHPLQVSVACPAVAECVWCRRDPRLSTKQLKRLKPGDQPMGSR